METAMQKFVTVGLNQCGSGNLPSSSMLRGWRFSSRCRSRFLGGRPALGRNLSLLLNRGRRLKSLTRAMVCTAGLNIMGGIGDSEGHVVKN